MTSMTTKVYGSQKFTEMTTNITSQDKRLVVGVIVFF